MPMLLAEFNPMILFLLLWGLFSWFSKKKKNQLNEKDQGECKILQQSTCYFYFYQRESGQGTRKNNYWEISPNTIFQILGNQNPPVHENKSFILTHLVLVHLVWGKFGH